MTGRPPEAGESRDQYLRVRLASFEARKLDVARGERTRSDYVRELIEADAEDKGLS
jgi:predicted DNA-binding protein